MITAVISVVLYFTDKDEHTAIYEINSDVS